MLPVLGDDVEGLRRKIAEWHAVGYTVYLHNNRVPILHAFGRALLRTLATGRWINPLVIRACQDNPTRAYNEVKKEADYYDQFSNDVPLGEKPFWEDGNYSTPPTETLGDWMDRGLNEEKPTEQELMDDWGGLDS